MADKRPRVYFVVADKRQPVNFVVADKRSRVHSVVADKRPRVNFVVAELSPRVHFVVADKRQPVNKVERKHGERAKLVTCHDKITGNVSCTMVKIHMLKLKIEGLSTKGQGFCVPVYCAQRPAIKPLHIKKY